MRTFDVFAWVAYCARQYAHPNACEIMERGVRIVENHYAGEWDRSMRELWDKAYD